jgi:hypothetical protein
MPSTITWSVLIKTSAISVDIAKQTTLVFIRVNLVLMTQVMLKYLLPNLGAGGYRPLFSIYDLRADVLKLFGLV